MSREEKIAKALLTGFAVILFLVGYGALIYVDWKIALGVFIALWSNNIMQNTHK